MAAPVNPIDIMPPQVANKCDKKALLEAIRMTLSLQRAAIRHNTQTFNRNRYTAISRIFDYDEMKDRARQTQEKAIANLPQLLSQLEASVRANGGHFLFANSAADAHQYIRDVLVQHEVKLVVKGKSITWEETRLNHSLEAAGIEVAESDLAEFILQVADEQPLHLIAPALDYSRECSTGPFQEQVPDRPAARYGKGYKHESYELSMAVGADLFAQVNQAEQEGGPRALVASGTCCREQLMAGMGRTALHPAEVLESTL